MQQRRETCGCHSGLASAVGGLLDTDAQLEAEAQVRKLEEEPKLEKARQVSTSLLALQLANKVGEQEKKLENLVCVWQS